MTIIDSHGYLGNQSCAQYGFGIRTTPLRIFDCILFHSELDLLEIRLHELYDFVNYFVIVEAVRTFTDKKKPLYFKRANKKSGRFAKFKDKIIHLVLRETDFKRIRHYTAFQREGAHRRFIMRALVQHASNLQEGDALIISDIDEMIRPSTLQLVRGCDRLPPVLHLQLPRYMYSFEFFDGDFDYHSAIRTYSESAAPKQLSSLFAHSFAGTGPEGPVVLADAGWHCSFCFRYLDEFVDKMESYSHYSRVRPAHKDLRHIQQCICGGNDLFGLLPEAYSFRELIARWGPLERQHTVLNLPDYLIRHPLRFRFLLPGNCEREPRSSLSP
jgi:beta-1,4-mannosyl-glycoprotein beta-1,4-N-acetylglucosaminyltransferase